MSETASPATLVAMFILVIACVPLALWLLRRAPGIRASGSGQLAVIESLSLGARERLLVVRAGERYLLLGSTANAINLIDEMPGYRPAAPRASRFGAALGDAIARRENGTRDEAA